MTAPTLAPVPGSSQFRRLQVKSLLARPIFASGLHRLLLRGRGAVAVFHRVDDGARGSPIACTRDEFRRYLDFFARHFRVVPLSDLLDRAEARRGLSGCLAITFDDGYRDNFAHAAPELRARGLPACFFVTAGFIGSRMLPWWDAEYGTGAEWMSWDEVRALHAQGFEIGAHTLTHADLGAVDGAAADREIRTARLVVEREVGHPVTLFSFPYGAPQRMSDANRRRVRAAGYRCCLSSFGGTVAAGDDPYRLRRAPIGPWHLGPEHFGFELVLRPPAPHTG